MNLDRDFIELFYESNDKIKSAVDSLTEEEWSKNQHRQKRFSDHKETQSIVYIWSWDNYNDIDIHIQQNENELSQLVYEYANKIRCLFKENSVITKLMLAKVSSAGIIAEHIDRGNLRYIRRCHYVISTNDKCKFIINNNSYNFAEGKAIEINNNVLHSVINNGETDRVHLICDIWEK